MSETLVRVQRSGPVGHVILNRPDRRNALNGPLMRAFAAALDELRDDKEIRVLIVRGEGGVFSSGIDHELLMEVFGKSQHAPFRHLHRDLQAQIDRLEHMERPVIAMMSRYCVGMALELALAADFRIATEDCVMGLPEVAFGIIPDVGGTTRLVRTAGPQRAREMIISGRLVTARRARADGIVTEVHADEAAALAAAEALAAHLARFPPAALGMAKTLVQRSADVDTQTSYRLEGWAQSILLREPDVGASFPDALAYIKGQLEDPEDL